VGAVNVTGNERNNADKPSGIDWRLCHPGHIDDLCPDLGKAVEPRAFQTDFAIIHGTAMA
jgi:hypothetical protein